MKISEAGKTALIIGGIVIGITAIIALPSFFNQSIVGKNVICSQRPVAPFEIRGKILDEYDGYYYLDGEKEYFSGFYDKDFLPEGKEIVKFRGVIAPKEYYCYFEGDTKSEMKMYKRIVEENNL